MLRTSLAGLSQDPAGTRTEDLQGYINFVDTDQSSILRITDGTLFSNVILDPIKTNPVPPIVLSNDYNFVLDPISFTMFFAILSCSFNSSFNIILSIRH